MTDHEINAAMAKACPDVHRRFFAPDWTPDSPEGYAVNLNACHEAVMTLEFPHTQTLWRQQQDALWDVVSRRVNRDSVAFIWHCQNARPREICESFLRVKGMWKE